uniref:Putative secreted protein n=1 Tax=Ixodes ricinus TaxID=34613 RepID=A0A6B0U803_IXORI
MMAFPALLIIAAANSTMSGLGGRSRGRARFASGDRSDFEDEKRCPLETAPKGAERWTRVQMSLSGSDSKRVNRGRNVLMIEKARHRDLTEQLKTLHVYRAEKS